MDQIGDLGPAPMTDAAWSTLFGMGDNHYNGITVTLGQRTLGVDPLATDQLGNPRPADALGDIGAVEADN